MISRLSLLSVAAAFALATPALAQIAPEQATMDLWCGLAFNSAAAMAPPELTEEEKVMMESFLAGGPALILKSHDAHITAGFTEEQFTTIQADLEPIVVEQISGSGAEAAYSVDQCQALITPVTQ